MIPFDTQNGTAFIDPRRVVGVEQQGDDVCVMLDGGHGILAVDAKVSWIAECIRDEIDDTQPTIGI